MTTQEEYAQRRGRPLPPKLPSIAELITQIGQAAQKIGGTLGSAQDNSARASLAGILSMYNQEIVNREITAKAKANAALISDPRAIEAKRTADEAARAQAQADRLKQLAAQAQAIKTAELEKQVADAKAAQDRLDAESKESAKVAAAATAFAGTSPVK